MTFVRLSMLAGSSSWTRSFPSSFPTTTWKIPTRHIHCDVKMWRQNLSKQVHTYSQQRSECSHDRPTERTNKRRNKRTNEHDRKHAAVSFAAEPQWLCPECLLLGVARPSVRRASSSRSVKQHAEARRTTDRTRRSVGRSVRQ